MLYCLIGKATCLIDETSGKCIEQSARTVVDKIM